MLFSKDGGEVLLLLLLLLLLLHIRLNQTKKKAATPCS
jgi:hypothetical protein